MYKALCRMYLFQANLVAVNGIPGQISKEADKAWRSKK